MARSAGTLKQLLREYFCHSNQSRSSIWARSHPTYAGHAWGCLVSPDRREHLLPHLGHAVVITDAGCLALAGRSLFSRRDRVQWPVWRIEPDANDVVPPMLHVGLGPAAV